MAPSNTVADVLTFEQLAARDYWQPQQIDGRAVQRPGPFVRAAAAPIRYRHDTPEPGEHTADLLAEARTANREVPA